MKFSFLEKVNNTVVFKGKRMDIIIPNIFFKQDISEEQGMDVKTFACFYMKVYDNLDDLSKYNKYQFFLPEMITFSYSQSSEEKEIPEFFNNKNDIEDNLDLADEDSEVILKEDNSGYKIYTLFENDLFIKNTMIVKSYKNTEKLVKLHQGAKIPNSVRYNDFVKLYLENMKTNGTDLQVPSVIIEVIISELARSKRNKEIPFRKVIGKNNSNVSQLDYRQIGIKTLAWITSTYTAMSSEDINKSLTYSVEKSRTGGSELESPIEKTIKY